MEQHPLVGTACRNVQRKSCDRIGLWSKIVSRGEPPLLGRFVTPANVSSRSELFRDRGGHAQRGLRSSSWNAARFHALSRQVATHLRGIGLAGRDRMLLLATFLGIVIVGQAANVMIAMAVEQYSETISLALFFVMFAGVIYGAWQLAVRITDRQANRQEPHRLERAGR
jgi:hypothetical protein